MDSHTQWLALVTTQQKAILGQLSKSSSTTPKKEDPSDQLTPTPFDPIKVPSVKLTEFQTLYLFKMADGADMIGRLEAYDQDGSYVVSGLMTLEYEDSEDEAGLITYLNPVFSWGSPTALTILRAEEIIARSLPRRGLAEIYQNRWNAHKINVMESERNHYNKTIPFDHEVKTRKPLAWQSLLSH